MIYVLKMDNPQSPTNMIHTRVSLIGPFSDEDHGPERWAELEKSKHDPYDNYRWQAVDLNPDLLTELGLLVKIEVP